MVTVLATFTVTAEAAVMAEARLITLRVFSFLGYDYKALLANDQCAVDFGVRVRLTQAATTKKGLRGSRRCANRNPNPNRNPHHNPNLNRNPNLNHDPRP